MRSEVRLAPYFQNSLIWGYWWGKSFCCSSIKTCIVSVLVSFLFIDFHTSCSLTLGHFLGWCLVKRKKPIRFPDAKFYAEYIEIKIFKNNHYFRSLLDPENRWCVLVQFEIFEQLRGTVKDSLKRFENYKCFIFHLPTCYYI